MLIIVADASLNTTGMHYVISHISAYTMHVVYILDLAKLSL